MFCTFLILRVIQQHDINLSIKDLDEVCKIEDFYISASTQHRFERFLEAKQDSNHFKLK